MNEKSMKLFRPYTSCEMVYDSMYALAYDLENKKQVFKGWAVLMNGQVYTVQDWLEWFYNKFIRIGAKQYEKV